jgi:hypothetical protein
VASPTRVLGGSPTHTQFTWGSKLERTKVRHRLADAGISMWIALADARITSM